jgi:hypothetical protein
VPVALDEFPLHQAPLSLRYVASSDRNFYDRCYFNAHDRTGEIFLITGLGIYPQLGVKDAYVVVRRGDEQRVVRMSDALDDERMSVNVGPYSIEVADPLHRIHLVCDADSHGVGFDLTWQAAFPAVDEERHLLRSGIRPILDTWRFAQLGTWEGEIRVGGDSIAVSPEIWVGSRDRSWGIRPIGEAEPAGRPQDDAADFGFWWLYVPMKFDDFAVVLIAQEDGNGHRTLNDAVRVHPDGRLDQLGWPRATISYRSGSRHPERARIEMTEPDGSPVVMEVETLGSVPLHVGCGYGGDPEWVHGAWKGRDWIEGAAYDMTDPAIQARTPYGVIDHVGRATLRGGLADGAVGWGLFEHGTFGKHAPSGFADFAAVAP